MTKLAGIYFYKWILENNLWGKVLIDAPIHDEWVIEFPKNLGKKPAEKLKECMIEAGNVFCKTVPIDASLEIGTQWDH